MPRNGSGGYALPGGINPVITQTLITSSWANTTLADVAAALTQSLSKDGQTIPTNNLPMGGFRHTGVGDPVLRDNYATLGFIQDGSHYQLQNIAGINAISSTLPGGITTYSLGMIVQLQPVGTSTGPVTLDINGIGPKPLVSSIGNQLGAGDLVSGHAYMLMYNGTGWEILNGGDSASFAQAAMSGWDRPASGVYPSITQVNPTTINVPAGTGRVVAPSTRDISGVTEVSWPAQNVVLTNLASAWNTVIAVNSFGTIVQLTGSQIPAAARDNIFLGSVTHMSGSIDSIRQRPSIYADMIYGAYDLAQVFNNMLVSGGQITQNATAMHMDMSGGIYFSLGSTPNNITGPNLTPFNAQVNFNFYPVTGNNTVAAATNVAPVGNYDPLGAGTVTAIPGAANATVIHRIYMMAGGTMVWLYGQAVYTDQITALRELVYDTQNLKLPSKLVNATLIATIVAAKGCVSLANTADCRIIPQGGTSYTIGVAGSISEAPVDGSSYGRKNSTWAKVVDTVVAGDGITVNSADPNKPIVAMGSSFAGPKTLTSGNFNLSATSNIIYGNVAMTFFGNSVDGSDNQGIQISSAGALGTTRGAYLELFGNENAGAGQARLFSGNGANITLGGGSVVIPNGSILSTFATGEIVFSNVAYTVRADTTDSTDNKLLQLAGGGGAAVARGAFIQLGGNEHASVGSAVITAGNAVGSLVKLEGADVQITGNRLYGTGLHNNAGGMAGVTNQYVGSGTYTPTITNTTNISTSSIPAVWQFIRVGNVVHMSGQINITPTAAGAVEAQVTLPIASNLAAVGNLVGVLETVTGASSARVAGAVVGDTATDRARVLFDAQGTASHNVFVTATYTVLP